MRRICGLLWLLFAFAAIMTPAAATEYNADLNGLNETSPNASPGIGFADLNVTGNLLTLNVSFSGLTSGVSAAHIHCCITPPTATSVVVPFVGFPTGVTSGTYSHVFDLSDPSIYSAAFVTANGNAAGAKAALIAAFNTGTQSYVNIHTSTFPGGEIRGFPTAVPEPSTFVLLVVGIAGIVGVAFGRRG